MVCLLERLEFIDLSAALLVSPTSSQIENIVFFGDISYAEDNAILKFSHTPKSL